MVLVTMESPYLQGDTPESQATPSPQKDIGRKLPPSGRVTINDEIKVMSPEISPVPSEMSLKSVSDDVNRLDIPDKRKKSIYLRSATSLLAVIDIHTTVL